MSHHFAWQQTRRREGITGRTSPVDDFFWTTAAMKNATTKVHIDTRGYATCVDNMTGSKYWVVLARHRDLSSEDCRGQLSSMFAYGRQWDSAGAGTEAFQHEAVVLRPGTML
jgi:hypothetical protein